MFSARSALLVLTAIALAACATLPEKLPRPAPAYAMPAQGDSVFAPIEASIRAHDGADASGFLLLDSNEKGLTWRLALIDSATHSLDLQYYVWFGDASGTLLMRRTVQAADRGVKVRILLDDLNSMLRDMTTPEIRDGLAAAINAHPNIEMRLFNAWKNRSFVGRGADTLADPDRLNRRMHNKVMIADNQAVILGGRNIGDEYMGLNADFNFHDLDVLGIGPVARQASAVFDRFWNSEWVVPVSALGIPATKRDLDQLEAPVRAQLAAARSLERFPPDPQDWSGALAQLPGKLQSGTSRVHTDTPDHDAVNHHMPAAIRALIDSAQREVLITNAYIIPGEPAVQGMSDLHARGVKVRILTNSLASHDVPAVNSHYKGWRKPILQTGAELYEIRPDAAVKALIADTPPTQGEFMGLHTKAIVIDRTRVFIGSMNLDPRSAEINSEMGVVIDSPGLAQALATTMERDMRPENSWRVELDTEGRLRWVAGDQVLSSQPARSWWQRVEDVVFMAFPKEIY
jgi:putative cardiolipin synthase